MRRARQSLHQVEAVGLDRHQWQVEPTAQPGRVRATGNHHVAVLAAQALADHLHRLFEAEVDLLDARAAVELGNDVTQQAGQPRNADRPDHRATGVGVGMAQGRAGQIHGADTGTGVFHDTSVSMFHMFQCCRSVMPLKSIACSLAWCLRLPTCSSTWIAA
jgi:hypothetical protein